MTASSPPVACHHGADAHTHTSESRSIDEENRARLAAMSEEQILEEQRKLLQTLGDTLLLFLFNYGQFHRETLVK